MPPRRSATTLPTPILRKNNLKKKEGDSDGLLDAVVPHFRSVFEV
jgi:hypothetical protein